MTTKIYNIISEIKLSSPKNADILIFNESGSEFLGKYILFDLDYEILYNGIKNIRIGPKILYFLIKSLFTTHKDPGLKLTSRIYRSYVLAYFDCVRPKVTISFIDNNPLLDWVSENYERSTFYVIQNALRIANEECCDDHCKPELATVQNFFCFGDIEKNFYIKSGSKIKKFHPVGSLKGSIYKYFLNNQNNKIKYDLCLVSQYREAIMQTADYPLLKKTLDKLAGYLKRFSSENNITLTVAFARNDPGEYEYFKKYLGTEFIPLYSDYENFSVYEAMDLSDVVISFCSTASIEAFGWGKKILVCNYTGSPVYDFSLPDICKTNDDSYDEFSGKLLNLLAMDINDYDIKTRDMQKYTMNYNTEYPVNVYVREMILKDIIVNS